MRKLLVIVGTRPNFVKVTQFKRVAAERGDFTIELLHTGQHSDAAMSTAFFEQFGLQCDHVLAVPDGSPAARLGRMISSIEPVVRMSAPDAVVVVGDVDSTLAGALAANKLGVPLVHVESGLRNGDLGMPEEVNRILTDRIAQHCFTTEPSGQENLLKEGITADRIHHVGNTMIDALVAFADRIEACDVSHLLGPAREGHVLVTLHRPANVDTREGLLRTIELIEQLAQDRRIVFPVHPRTMSSMERFSLDGKLGRIADLVSAPPLSYFEFQKLIASSAFVVTDSGGVQEETTWRGIPCLTLRPSTERPITITEGTNELVTFDHAELSAVLRRIREGSFKKGKVPALWDGRATERIFDVLNRVL
ncbi:MAG: UDP-N-acetylglucosamine 2-epimerase (non-hydrolyzing) [Flavobacteriales bacterium]|nr:UDP-N-acetylglucosamine 2-epimerase (non-hydrolyzing) [Flavobacteriales bacterium]